MCLSKGLGAPVGSVLVGSAELIAQARVWRKRYGAGMRQAGILAAAGHYALDHHVDRLADDHARARRLAQACAEVDPTVVDPAAVSTNIVILDLTAAGRSAAGVVDALAAHGVLASAFGPQRIRLVTHLDVDDDATDRAERRAASGAVGLTMGAGSDSASDCQDRRVNHADARALPPGQRPAAGWPVLHYGPVPHDRGERWDLRVTGATEDGQEHVLDAAPVRGSAAHRRPGRPALRDPLVGARQPVVGRRGAHAHRPVPARPRAPTTSWSGPSTATRPTCASRTSPRRARCWPRTTTGSR